MKVYKIKGFRKEVGNERPFYYIKDYKQALELFYKELENIELNQGVKFSCVEVTEKHFEDWKYS